MFEQGRSRPGPVLRNHGPALAAFAFALALRAVYLALLSKESPTFERPEGGDSIFYDRVALGEDPGRAYFHAPLYQWLLRALYVLFGRDLTLVRGLQHVAGAATTLVVYALAYRLFRRRSVALVASLLQSLLGPCIFYEGQLLVDAVLPFVSAAAALALLGAYQSKRGHRAFLAGAWIGVAALGRANALVWLPLAIVAFFVQERREQRSSKPSSPGRRALLLAAGTALTILPATIHNLRAEPDPVLITSNAGLNLYIGNNPHARGAYNHPDALWFRAGDPQGDFAGARAAQRILGHAPSSLELSRFWREQAIDHAVAHPGHTTRLALTKLLLLLNDYEYPQLYNYYAYRDVVSVLSALPTAGWVTAPAIAALLLLARSRAARSRSTLRFFALLGAAYALSFVPFFVVGRYRAAWLPWLTPLAGWAIVELLRRCSELWTRHSRRAAARLAWLGGAIFGSALVTFLPAGRIVGSLPTGATQYYEFAHAAFQNRDKAAAERWCRKSIGETASFGPAYALLATVLVELGREREAIDVLAAGATAAPRDARVHRELGRLLRRAEDLRGAEQALHAAISAEPRSASAWLLLGELLAAEGREAEARSALSSVETLLSGVAAEAPRRENH